MSYLTEDKPLSQHTPGPWKVRSKTMIVAHTAPRVLGKSEMSIIATTDNPRLPPDLCEANARLIARAPEMYEFLKETIRLQPGERTSAMRKLGSDALSLLKRI